MIVWDQINKTVRWFDVVGTCLMGIKDWEEEAGCDRNGSGVSCTKWREYYTDLRGSGFTEFEQL